MGGCSSAQPPKPETLSRPALPPTPRGRHGGAECAHNLRGTAATYPPRPPARLRAVSTTLRHRPSNSPLSCSPPFLSVALKRLSTHLERASSISCQKRTALPRRSPLARSSGLPAQLLGQGASRALPCFVLNDELCPSALSSSLRSGTTRNRGTLPGLPCPVKRRTRAPTQAFSPASAFESPR